MNRKCPECGSENIEKEFIDGRRTYDLICKNCGNSGMPKDFDAPDEIDLQKELINFINSTKMDDDIKLALQKHSKFKAMIQEKPSTLLKRAIECKEKQKELLDRLPDEIRYAFIYDYIVYYNQKEGVIKDFDFIKNEKDVFYLIKPKSKSVELIIFNGRSLEALDENDKGIGFLWGYIGGGTLPTAKVILKECFPNKPFMLSLAGEFSTDMLDADKLINDANGIIKKQDVLDWYKNLNIVKRACKELGITQKELADKLGVSKPSVERWTQGDTPDQAVTQINLLIENNTMKKELEELKNAIKTIIKYAN